MKISQLLALTVLSVAFGDSAFAQTYAVPAKAKGTAPVTGKREAPCAGALPITRFQDRWGN
jgi:hypothetical protein